MCGALVSIHGLKNEIYSFVVRLFRLLEIKERDIFMCSALVSAYGARLFRLMD